MRRPQFVAQTSCIGKTKTAGVRIKNERDDFSIDFARDSVWFRVQHFSFFAGLAPFPLRYDVSHAAHATSLACAFQQGANEAKAKRMPVIANKGASDSVTSLQPPRSAPPLTRKRRARLLRRTPAHAARQLNERSASMASGRV